MLSSWLEIAGVTELFLVISSSKKRLKATNLGGSVFKSLLEFFSCVFLGNPVRPPRHRQEGPPQEAPRPQEEGRLLGRRRRRLRLRRGWRGRGERGGGRRKNIEQEESREEAQGARRAPGHQEEPPAGGSHGRPARGQEGLPERAKGEFPGKKKFCLTHFLNFINKITGEAKASARGGGGRARVGPEGGGPAEPNAGGEEAAGPAKGAHHFPCAENI